MMNQWISQWIKSYELLDDAASSCLYKLAAEPAGSGAAAFDVRTWKAGGRQWVSATQSHTQRQQQRFDKMWQAWVSQTDLPALAGALADWDQVVEEACQSFSEWSLQGLVLQQQQRNELLTRLATARNANEIALSLASTAQSSPEQWKRHAASFMELLGKLGPASQATLDKFLQETPGQENATTAPKKSAETRPEK